MKYGDPPPDCAICGDQTHHYSAVHCQRCKKIRDRFEFRFAANKPEWERALKVSWDPEARCFRCYFTGVELVVGRENVGHPRFLEREHLTPGDDSRYAACASLINRMKGTMDEVEFRQAILAVAASYRKCEPLSTVTLRDRIKSYLGPDDLRRVVVALDARFRGEDFSVEILDRLDA